MAKEIKFNIKLLVDGKEQLTTATTSTKELREQIQAAKTAADHFRDKLITLNQSIERLQTLSKGLNEIADVFKEVTEESRSFSVAMNAANTMAGKSGDDFAKLKGEVAELSKTLPVARDELANGLYQVISNGVPEDNWIAYLQKSAKASVGGIADLGETVKVTSTVIKNYGLTWDAAGDIQDKIQLTAKNGVTSFEQLAQALPRVTANAATLGVSVDELMATFATLTGVSGNTAEVSTQLAAVFTALVKPSGEATKMAQQMGIQFDAAAIKAAGGMHNFLTGLDSEVKAYASKNGMLEQTIYGKLFGSAESLRALVPLTGQLASKFNENLEAMKDSAGTIDDAFATMSSSGAASFQMLKNKFGEFTDGLMSVMSEATPYLNITAQVGNSIIAVLALTKVLQSFATAHAVATARILTTNAASVIWNATSVRMNALAQLLSATFRGTAVSAATLKLAIQGLMISTGVGVAIWALTEAVSALTSSSDKAADSTRQLTAEEQAAQAAREQEAKQRSEITAALDINIAKLKDFKGNKAEEKKLVEDMNRTYGKTLGYYSTVAQWYTALTGNSKAYCQQMINELRIRKLANEAATLAQKQRDITHDENGKTRKYSTKRERKVTRGFVDDGTGHLREGYVYQETESELDKKTKEVQDLRRKEQAKRKEMEALVKQNAGITYKQYAGYSATDPNTSTTPNGTTDGTTVTTPKTEESKTYVEQLRAQLSAAQKQMDAALTVEARVEASAKVADIQAQIDEATKGKVSVEAVAEPAYIVQGSMADKRQSRTNAQGRISRIQQDYEIGIIGKDEAERQIAEINGQLEQLGVKPVEVQLKTRADELQEQLQRAQREFAEAATIEAKVKANAKVADIQAQINRETNGKLTIEADVDTGYIVQGSAADKRQSYGNAKQKASRIQQDYEIGLIGKDEAKRQIADLNAEIAKLGMKPIELELDTDGFTKAFDNIKSGWGSIQGIGSGVDGITSALEGDKNAWEAISGVINGFISIAEGIQGIVSLVNLLTVATEASTAATGAKSAATAADTAATTVNTVTTTATTAAAVTNTAAKSGEAITSATASGAKMPFPLNIVAIAAGVAAVIAALAAVSGFATGGVVGGNMGAHTSGGGTVHEEVRWD